MKGAGEGKITPLVVQWLRVLAPRAGVVGLIPVWGTKISHAAEYGQKKKEKEEEKIALCFDVMRGWRRHA